MTWDGGIRGRGEAHKGISQPVQPSVWVIMINGFCGFLLVL